MFIIWVLNNLDWHLSRFWNIMENLAILFWKWSWRLHAYDPFGKTIVARDLIIRIGERNLKYLVFAPVALHKNIVTTKKSILACKAAHNIMISFEQMW